MLIAICLFLVVAFTGSFVVGLESSREQYANQLRSHAQDAATALGLSLTPHVDDPAMMDWDLGREYAALGEALDYDRATLGRIALDGIASTWLDAGEQAALTRTFETELAGAASA